MGVLVIDELLETLWDLGLTGLIAKIVHRWTICGNGVLDKNGAGCVSEGIPSDVLLFMLRICFLRFERFENGLIVYDCRVRSRIVDKLWLELNRSLISCHRRER